MLFAGFVAASALTLFALAQTPATAPALAPTPAPVPLAVSTGEDQDGPRSVRYYPEDLAALESMSNFRPIADQGEKRKPGVVAASPKPASFEPKPAAFEPKPAPFAPKPARRADAAPKSVVAVASPAQAPRLAPPPAGAAAPHDKTVKILGVPVPGARQIGDRVVAVRDTAGHWGAAVAGFGEKLVTFWR